MKKLLLLLMIVPMIAFGQSEDIDPVRMIAVILFVIGFVYVGATLMGGSDNTRNDALKDTRDHLKDISTKLGNISRNIYNLTEELKQLKREKKE